MCPSSEPCKKRCLEKDHRFAVGGCCCCCCDLPSAYFETPRFPPTRAASVSCTTSNCRCYRCCCCVGSYRLGAAQGQAGVGQQHHHPGHGVHAQPIPLPAVLRTGQGQPRQSVAEHQGRCLENSGGDVRYKSPNAAVVAADDSRLVLVDNIYRRSVKQFLGILPLYQDI